VRLHRLPALLVTAALLGGASACSKAVEGSGGLAEGAATPTPTESTSSAGSGSPAPSSSTPETSPPSATASPAPIPTVDPVTSRRRILCVVERASIAAINGEFNKAKDRTTQIGILRTGASTISGQLGTSQLAANDRIRAYGQSVLNQLNTLVRAANSGGTPSTAPYNKATQDFQKACNTV
jgi:hypothetical protein